MGDSMKLVVGLGNPELRYMTTRHNAGFWIIDKIATKYGANYNRSSSLQADTCKTTIDGQSIVLAKPSTYMNLSGRAVQGILHWYKIPVENCLVVHDDVALPLGRIRFQQGGGAGGQHGVENIIEMLGGNKSFDRLKFGVGPDPGGDRRADYVLTPVAEEDRDLRDKAIDMAVDGFLLWLRSGVGTAANKFNGIDLRPEPEPPAKPAEAVLEMPAFDSAGAVDENQTLGEALGDYGAADQAETGHEIDDSEEEELEAPPPPW